LTMSATRKLLACGAAAGPLFVLVYMAQAFGRVGFDIARHPASLLSNGDLGWIQITNFLVTGLLVIAGAIGMRRALHPGPAGTWGPVLIGLSGIGLLLAGLFVAEPMDGFPPGTPPGPPAGMTTSSLLHFAASLIGFSAWIAACFVFARRFAARGQTAWAGFSAATGALFLAAFVSTASGLGPIVFFVLGVTLVWAWLSATSVRLMQEVAA
jgi:Protein of unknown function (DUF998)